MHLLPKFKVYKQDKKEMGTFELGETNPELEELYMEADDFFLEYEYSKSKKKL